MVSLNLSDFCQKLFFGVSASFLILSTSSTEVMSKDIGIEVIESIYNQLQIDDKWAIKDERGFTWWSHNLAQKISVSEGKNDLGLEMFKLQSRTEFLKDFPSDQKSSELLGMYMRFSSLSGITPHPTEENRFELVSTMWVHKDVKDFIELYFMLSSLIQNIEAHIMAPMYAETLSAKVDISAHPSNGKRNEPDDMLGILEDFVRPKGEEISLWIGEEMNELRSQINNSPKWFSMGDDTSLSAEFPYPGETSLMNFNTSEQNPRMGNGLLITIRTRKGVVDTKTALDWNYQDHYGDKITQNIGSWSVADTGLAYVSFIPNVMFRRGATVNLGFWMMNKLMNLHQ